MSKILINDINTQFGFKAAINEKLAQIQDEFNDKVLYRDNPIGEPNVMSSDLDMGGNDILNINKITVNDIGVVGESSFQELIVEAQAAATAAEEQATLSGLYKDAAALSASQSATSATSAASAASDAQAAALLVDPRMDAVEAEVATQTTSINTFKNDVSNLFGALIGSIQSIFCSDSYVPLGMVPANGTEYSRSQFPDLYDNFLVGGKLLTTTYAAFTTQVGLTGNCAKFALDTVNQKFKVPLLKAGDSITHAASAAELGKSVKAGLPNIKASTGPVEWMARNTSGAMYSLGTTDLALSGSAASSRTDAIVGFDASLYNPIYQNGVTTVLDEQVRLRHFVVLASAQNNSSMFDWSNYMAALAGKANKNLDNVTNNAIGLYLYARDEKAPGTNGGSTSAYTWHTRDLNTVKFNSIPGASLSSNRVTLPAGRYLIWGRTPSYAADSIRSAIYSVTGATYLAYGSTIRSVSSGAAADSIINCAVDLSVQTTIELRMWARSAFASGGLGYVMSDGYITGVNEVYSELRIWKM